MTKINSIFALLLIIYPAYTFVISPYDSVLKRSQSSIIKMGPDDHVLASRIQEISHQLNLIESLIKNSRNSVLSNANVATIPLSAEKKLTKEKPLVCASFEQPTKEFINSASLCHLEAVPYWNQESIPINIFKPKDPYIGKIVDVKRLTGPESPGEVCHITIDHGGNLPYWEGQSLNVIPPGVDSNGKPHKVRLYSIASTRYGDNGSGQTVTLCVRRALYIDPTTGKSDPSKAGVCSTFLCEAKPGMDISIAGPSGKVMLLPEHEPHTDIIMVGTGTGVAPYRGFIRRLFQEDTPASRAYTGSAWLFLGVANRDAALYHNDWMSVVRRFPFNFRYDLALSREQKNKKGGKLYIQDKMEEYADELFNKLDNGAHIYFCGLKGMMPGIVDMLERVADSKGISWDNKLSELKKKGQWHVEVY